MIEFFTPDEWYSIFPKSNLIIDDDQYIYRGDDYSRKNPIGFVDWSNGQIFGAEYLYNRSVRPIAYIIPDHNNVLAIYSEKDTNGYGQPKFSAKALFYIKDDTVYDAYPDWLSGGGGTIGKNNNTPPTPSGNASIGGGGISSVLIIPLLIVLPGLLLFIIPENLTMILLVTGIVALGAVLIAGFHEGFVFEGRILGGIGGALIAFFGVGFIWFLFNGLRDASGIAEPNEALEDIGFIMIAAAGFLANCIGDGTQKKTEKKSFIPPFKNNTAVKQNTAQNMQNSQIPKQRPNAHNSGTQQKQDPQKPANQPPTPEHSKKTVQPQPTSFTVISCSNCGAKLKVPIIDGTLEITCPKCKNTFKH